MRATLPRHDVALAAFQLEHSHAFDEMRKLNEGYAAATPDMILAILDEAARFAARHLEPLNLSADLHHCRIEAGRVVTPPGHRDAWQAYVDAGWPTLDQPEVFGGQGLPLVLAAAVQEAMDRACPAFGMLPVPQRSASRLIAAWGAEALRAEWLPKLASGEWGATICISEADAGSDVGRVRTRAEPDGDGAWSLTGEKSWISFGDHDLTPRIGHCLLARTPGAAPGGAGLSLFLVPDTIEEGGRTVRNRVVPRRIEEKLGLHGSPTCALGFEGAKGWLLGEEGRGLAQMFVMITNMRLSVGVQGLGIACSAADVAWAYAAERRQGGSDAAVTIDSHADVRRMLMDMAARVDTLRGLVFALANLAELGAHEPDPARRAEAAALTQWLLPIVKTLGGEVAFENASDAIQVLGGAGYTREWPVEQALRDARVLTIFEGTTGIQALDLLQRRLLRGDRAGYRAFLTAARLDGAQHGAFARALDRFEAVSERLLVERNDAGATAYLRLAMLVATGWIAARNVQLEGEGPAARLASTARYFLHGIDARADLLGHEALSAAERLGHFAH